MNNNIFEEIGYEPITTFWQDFTIADKFVGVEKNPIEDTYKRALKYAETDYKLLTELVLVLNHKIWEWYKTNIVTAQTYNGLWIAAEDRFFELFKDNDEAVDYFYRVTD